MSHGESVYSAHAFRRQLTLSIVLYVVYTYAFLNRVKTVLLLTRLLLSVAKIYVRILLIEK